MDKNNETPIRAILFDVDGVIVMSEPLHQEKIFAAARDPLNTGKVDNDRGVIITQTQWNQELAGIGDHRIYEWVLSHNPQYPLSEEKFISTCTQYYLDHADSLDVRPGIPETFDAFYNAGLPIGIVSSGTRPQVDRNLEVAGIIDKVSFTISADDIPPGKTKPDPTPYLIGLEKLNATHDHDTPVITATECLVIEDSGSGVKSGHTAGMKTIQWLVDASSKFNPDADYQLKHDDSLLELTERIIAQNVLVRDLAKWRSQSASPVPDTPKNSI